MSTTTKTFAPGDAIITKGEPATSAFLILKGTAQVYLDQGERIVTLAELTIGSIFGESALFEENPTYGAHVKAIEETELALIDPSDFQEKLDHCDPVIQSIIRSLIERQRTTNATLLAREAQEYMELDLVDAPLD